MIKDNTIVLFPDHNEINIHFKYKDIEVSSELHNTEFKKLVQRKEDNDIELVEEDVFRDILIHMKIDDYLNLDDDSDLTDDLEDDKDDLLDDYDDDIEESYQYKLEKHFPGQYLTKLQKEKLSKAKARVYIIRALSQIENKDIYIFMSTNGLTFEDNYIRFYAPTLSKNQYEYMFWCVNIIDKVIKTFIEDEDEDDEIELTEEV